MLLLFFQRMKIFTFSRVSRLLGLELIWTKFKVTFTTQVQNTGNLIIVPIHPFLIYHDQFIIGQEFQILVWMRFYQEWMNMGIISHISLKEINTGNLMIKVFQSFYQIHHILKEYPRFYLDAECNNLKWSIVVVSRHYDFFKHERK